MITIPFSRATKTARFAMPAQHADFFTFGVDPYFDVARAMTDAGMPDGPAVFVDERGMACLTVRSLHSCARRYRPNAGDREYVSWFKEDRK